MVPEYSLSIRQPDTQPAQILRVPRGLPSPYDHLHRRDHHLLVFVEEGEGDVRVGGWSENVAGGTGFLVAPGELIDPTGLRACARWLVAFSAIGLDGAEGQSFAAVFRFDPDIFGRHALFFRPNSAHSDWSTRLRELSEEPGRRMPLAAEALRAGLIHLTIEARRAWFKAEGGRSDEIRALLREVFRFIDAHYHESIGLREVAEHVDRSPAHLTTLVRRETGRTVVDWVIERRLLEACRMLSDPDMPMGEIARRLGYGDASYFSKQFKQVREVSPSEWRARNVSPGW